MYPMPQSSTWNVRKRDTQALVRGSRKEDR